MKRLLLIVAVVCLPATQGSAAEPAGEPDYATHAAPLFAKYCAGCHNETEREGELVLQTFEHIVGEAPSGPLVVPGKSAESRLIKVLTGQEEPAMPPEDNPRPGAEEIAKLAAWIDAGAKRPSGEAPDPTVINVPAIVPRDDVSEALSALAFAPDGKSLAAARFNEVELIGLPARLVTRKLGPHRGRINSVRYAADGTLVVVGSGEPGVVGEAKIWRAADGELVVSVTGHADSIYAAALSADGKLLATGSYDQQIKLWDATTGKEIRTLSGHNDAVFDLAFRPDGKILASASGDRTVKLWDVASGERLDTLGQPTKEQYCVAFSPDGKRVAGGGADNRIRVWQVSEDARENTNPLLYSRFAHEGPVVNVVYSADGVTLVSAGEDRTVKIWDAAPMNERLLLEKQSDWAPALAIAPDAKSIAVGRLDGSLAMYDTQSGGVIPPPPPPKPELLTLPVQGVQSGIATRVSLAGKHLADATAVKASHDGIQATIVGERADGSLQVDVHPAANVPRGKYEVWVVSPAGESERRPLFVDELVQLAESEPNDALPEANRTPLEAGVWGVLAAQGDVDRYKFTAKAGQSLVLEIAAASIGSKANTVLTVADADGRVLADNNDFGGQSDSLLEFRPPADGEYVVAVADLMREGSAEHRYRLSLGELAVPTAVFPLSIPAEKETEVLVSGYNLPPGLKVTVPASKAGEVVVPLDAARFRLRQPLKVLVGTLGETLEIEPNDAPESATPLVVPATVNGRSLSGSGAGDDDFYRFTSKAGETWIVETDAQRRGAPTDTVIDVLDAEGNPIERVLLQAVRDSNVTFRGIDSVTRDCRLVNWEEMQLNQFLYINGEVVRLFRAPRGPDSGFLFYEGDGGKRLLYFDTSATVHAVETPAFIVEPHPPGTKLISTGLPVFPLYYTNDDCCQRRIGSDSRLTFTAPADGQYLVRVRDSQGAAGEMYGYRLTVRRPAPDFVVRVSGGDKPAAGSGDEFAVTVERIDGFDDAVTVEMTNLPEGFTVSTPIVIQPGHREAQGVLLAAADAKQPTEEALKQIKVQARAHVGNSEVVKDLMAFGGLRLAEKPKLLVRLEPSEITIAPGSTVTATIKVERNGYDDLIKFEVQNLPHGIIVDNIGLSGVMMPKGETERQIFLTAAPWVPETDRLGFAVEQQAGGQCSPPIMVRVRKPDTLAEAQ